MTPRTRKKTPTIGAHSKRLLQLLHHLGWADTSISPPERLSGIPGVEWQAAPLPDGQHLLLLHCGEPLPGLATVYKHYEDFPTFHRRLQAAIQDQGLRSHLGMLCDPRQTVQFIDFRREEILIEAHGEREITDNILPILALDSVARGHLHSFPRKSVAQRALELADWTRLWTSRIGAASGGTPDSVERFLHWLHLCRHAELHGIGPRQPRTLANYCLKSTPPHPVRYLLTRFSRLHGDLNLLQGASMEAQRLIARASHQQGQLAPCLDSFSRVAAGKFTAEVFAEAFSDEELRRTGWRHSLVERPDESGDGPERWLAGPYEADLDRMGFPSLIRQFDLITDDLRNLARQHAVAFERGEQVGLQLDLLGGDPPTFHEDEAPRLTLQKALNIRTRDRRRGETARLVLLARVAEWHQRLHRPDLVFPIPRISAGNGKGRPPAPRAVYPPPNPSLN